MRQESKEKGNWRGIIGEESEGKERRRGKPSY